LEKAQRKKEAVKRLPGKTSGVEALKLYSSNRSREISWREKGRDNAIDQPSTH
jgi:hypothetical protein